MTTTAVTNTLKSASGVPLVGAWVTVELVIPAFDADTQAEIVRQGTLRTDSSGTYTVGLIPNAELSPAGTYYSITESGGVVHQVYVPASATPVWLADLPQVTVPPVPPESAIYLRADAPQALSDAQQTQLQENAGFTGGTAGVASVNGHTGVVTLAAADVGAAPEPTGTPDGTKFYADDGSWKTPPGGSSGTGLGYVTAADHGATGNGTTDDTAALQAAIDTTPDGGTLYIAAGIYKLTAGLTCSKNITIRGAGSTPAWGSILTDFNSINAPIAAPWLNGTVLRMDTAATNVLTLNGAGKTQHLYGLGILFGDTIRFTNTGHGIVGSPPTISGGRDNGVSGSVWENVVVFGHDGNHYGFYVINGIYNTWTSLQSFGGGGFHIQTASPSGHYGNLVATSIYAQIFCRGSAHGLDFMADASGWLNLMQFNRPQCSVVDMTATYAGTTAPTSAQRMVNSTSYVGGVAFNSADFETNVGSAPVLPPGIGGGPSGVYISPDSFINNYTMPGNTPTGSAGGDLAGNYPNPTLAASGVTAGTYGNGSTIPVLTIDAKGRITTATTTPAVGGGGTGSDLVTLDAGTQSFNDSGADLIANVTNSKWGIDANGPYYNSAGVTAGDEAALCMDAVTGELTLIKIGA